MKKLLFLIVLTMLLLPPLGLADIAAKEGNMAMFLKPGGAASGGTSGGWAYDDSHEWYVSGEKATRPGGRQFYTYEDYAGDGVLYMIKSNEHGLPQNYRHKGTIVISELGWSKQTPLTSQDVWEIWQNIPDTGKYQKKNVTQIQLLSDEMKGTCYVVDNKYGMRDTRIMVYGASLTGNADQDKALVEAQITDALKGKGPHTK